jgi:hypothetical protein
MSCCDRNTLNPGAATFSSGLTAQRAADARRCDQQRILQLLQQGGGNCCPKSPSNKSAVYSSVLTQDAAVGCQASPVQQAFDFPRVGTTESVRLQKTVDSLVRCSLNPDDPYNRLNPYRRFVVQPACPEPTAAQLNTNTPKQSFSLCQPSRFF